MKEIWKDVRGYEGSYQVSNFGRVKSLGRYKENHSKLQYIPERIKTLHERIDKGKQTGYLVTILYKNNNGKNCYVHRLVAEAFVPNPENKQTVNHINGDKHDNRAENLEWNTYQENNIHAYKTGLNDEKHRRNCKGSIVVKQLTLDGKLIAVYPSIREAERQTGICSQSISIGLRKGWRYGGYIWEKVS